MLYVTYNDLGSAGYVGIKKKILAQISVLKKVFGRAYYTCYEGQMMYLMDGEDMLEKDVAVTRKECNMILSRWIEKYGITKTYIRYNLADKWFFEFLRFQKEHRIRTVLEIPTYPYDDELGSGKTKSEDAYFREQLWQYLDVIATYTDDEKIWGISCVSLRNGIDISNIPISKKNKNDHAISFIAVSSMAPWHGYERFLEGMHLYYKADGNYDLYLRFIGEGPEEDYYRSLTDRYGLNQRVEFCGRMTGGELDKKFDLSDMAVGSLGMYKIGISDGCPIKVAEYCARGIPFICGYNDTRFARGQDFAMRLSNDGKAVDMDDVIGFYEKISSKQDYRKIMRSYAEDHLTWESIMKPVIACFEEMAEGR